MLLPGCSKEGGAVSQAPSPEGIFIPFSLSIENASRVQTKMSQEITQTTNPVKFRGLENIYIIPFKTSGGVVTSSDGRYGANLGLPQAGIPADTFGDDASEGSFTGLVKNNNSHLYNGVYMREGTNSVLAYASSKDVYVSATADDSTAYKHKNGVLRHAGLNYAETPSGISFSLEPIIKDPTVSYNNWLNNLTNYLSGITNSTGYSYTYQDVKYNFYVWDTSGYAYPDDFVAAFRKFINDGMMFPATPEYIGKMLTDFYRAMYPYSTSKQNSKNYFVGRGYYVYEIAKEIVSKIAFNNSVVSTSGSGASMKISLLRCPADFGLPHGFLPLQYRESNHTFGTLFANSGIGVPSVTSYCYPPSLWYYVNSPVRATSDAEVIQAYKSCVDLANSDYTPVLWSDIVARYGSSFVKSDSKAAAIAEPLHYGTGMMLLSCNKLIYTSVSDGTGRSVRVNNDKFPLTGIVVADQRKNAYFDFSPVPSSDNMIIYDSDVYNGSSPRAFFSSHTASSEIPLLVMETEKGALVHFALEFVNKSGNTFYGINGCTVYPDAHFYLIGILDAASSSNLSGEDLESVFCKDHITRVSASFTDLRNAYTVLPDLREPQLVIGVDAVLDWDMVEPGTVPIR